MTGPQRYPGWSVVWVAFIVAFFAWGIGFHGMGVYLQTLHATKGWPIATISAAITAHFLIGAVIVVYLPEVHRKLGLAKSTILGAGLTAVGIRELVDFSITFASVRGCDIVRQRMGVDQRRGDQRDDCSLVRQGKAEGDRTRVQWLQCRRRDIHTTACRHDLATWLPANSAHRRRLDGVAGCAARPSMVASRSRAAGLGRGRQAGCCDCDLRCRDLRSVITSRPHELTRIRDAVSCVRVGSICPSRRAVPPADAHVDDRECQRSGRCG